jgi:hypothetical protein
MTHLNIKVVEQTRSFTGIAGNLPTSRAAPSLIKRSSE